VQLREAAAVAGERPALAGRTPPGLGGLDLQMDDRVRPKRRADALGAERPAAQCQHRGIRPREQLEHQLLLACAERLLALPVEERLDGLAQPLL
jgi:hypothetical protein